MSVEANVGKREFQKSGLNLRSLDFFRSPVEVWYNGSGKIYTSVGLLFTLGMLGLLAAVLYTSGRYLVKRERPNIYFDVIKINDYWKRVEKYLEDDEDDIEETEKSVNFFSNEFFPLMEFNIDYKTYNPESLGTVLDLSKNALNFFTMEFSKNSYTNNEFQNSKIVGKMTECSTNQIELVKSNLFSPAVNYYLFQDYSGSTSSGFSSTSTICNEKMNFLSVDEVNDLESPPNYDEDLNLIKNIELNENTSKFEVHSNSLSFKLKWCSSSSSSSKSSFTNSNCFTKEDFLKSFSPYFDGNGDISFPDFTSKLNLLVISKYFNLEEFDKRLSTFIDNYSIDLNDVIKNELNFYLEKKK